MSNISTFNRWWHHLYDLSLSVELDQALREADKLLAQFQRLQDLHLCAKTEQVTAGFLLDLKGQARGNPAVFSRRTHLLKLDKASSMHHTRQCALSRSHAYHITRNIGDKRGGRLLPIAGKVEIGWARAWFIQNIGLLDARDAIGAHLAFDGGYQVPGAAFGYQP